MIYELRTYTIQILRVPEWLDFFEKEVKPILDRHWNLVGLWHTDVGRPDQVVQLWAFEDLNRRAEQIQQLMEDRDLAKVLPKLMELEVAVENRILIPAPFSPLK